MTKRLGAREIARLLDQHAASLALYASQWTKSPDDCVQEAFVELAKQSIPENPAGWLFKVVRNRAINANRSEQRRKSREQLSQMQPHQTASPTDLLSELEAADEQQRMLLVLESLPDDQRELIVLRIWSGMTWGEIAKQMDTSSSSAQRNYVLALETMKENLETKCLTKRQ